MTTVCIDPAAGRPGYGGGVDRTLELGVAVATRLGGRCGVHLTRSNAAPPSLDQRLAAARQSQVFLSLSSSPAGGAGVWVHSEADDSSRALARDLGMRLGAGGPVQLRRGPLALLEPSAHRRGTAACLVDVGSYGSVEHAADAIAAGLEAFLGTHARYAGDEDDEMGPCGSDEPHASGQEFARAMVASTALVIGGHEHTIPGVSITNWHGAGVHNFVGRSRRGVIDELIIHESVTTSRTNTEQVLIRRGLGVHLMVDPSGAITQHTDLERRVAHAGGHNRFSVGIEVVNPYYPRHVPRGSTVWPTVIPARWAHRGRYVVPPAAQCEALWKLVEFLTNQSLPGSDAHRGLQIARNWIGYDASRKRIRMGRVAGAAAHASGVYAHHYFGHADGAFLALYCVLRSEAGQAAATAHANAVSLATGAGSWIDLSAHLP